MSLGGGTNVSQSSTLTQGQRELLDSLSSQLLNQLGSGVSAYPSQSVAGTSGLQSSAFSGLGGLSDISGLGYGTAANLLGQVDPNYSSNLLNNSYQNLLSATQDFDPNSVLNALEPARQQAINTFQDVTVPYLSEKYGATSGGSGAFNRAMAEAAGDLSLGLSAQASPYLIQGQQSALDRQLSGAGLGGTLAQIPGQIASQGLSAAGQSTDLLTSLLNAGTLQRGIEQEGLSQNAQDYYYSQAYNNPWLLNFLSPTLGTQAFENAYQQQTGLGQSLLPVLGSFAGSDAGSALISSGLSAALGMI